MIIQIRLEDINPECNIQNQVNTNASRDQKNQAPDMTTGNENMPAPIIVPPIIIAPPISDGVFVETAFATDNVAIRLFLTWLYIK